MFKMNRENYLRLSKTNWSKTLAGITLLTTCYAVSAEEDDMGSISLEDLLNLEVVTASKSAEKLSDAPATIYAFSKAQIEKRGYRSLDQLLEDVPEIEIQRRAVAEYNNYYSLRGIAGNDKLVILLDGYRINSPTGSPHAIASNYSLIDAERVEVILGPASALYGADALAGIINIITRNPNAEKQTNLFVSSGSFNTTEVSVKSRYVSENLNLLFSAQMYESDEDDMPKAYPEDFAWYNEQYLVNGIVQASPFAPPEVTVDVPIEPYSTPTKSHFIHFAGSIGEVDFGFAEIMESHSSSIGMRPEFNLYIEDAIFKTRIENMFVEHNYTSKDEKHSYKTSMSHSTYELTPESVFRNTFTGYSEGYKYAKGSTTKFEEQITYTMDESNQFIGGISVENITALPKTGDLPFAFNPDVPAASQGFYYIGTDITDVNGNDLTISQAFFDISYQNYAGYFQWQKRFNESLSLTAGIRYDSNTRYGSTTNPRAGLVYKATDDLTIKFLYNSGFLAPSPYVTFQHYGAFIPTTNTGGDVTGLFGPFWHLPNPQLKPEELESKEINMTWNISDSLRLSFDYYDNSLDQQIVPVVFVDSLPGIFDGTFQGVPIGAAEIPINNATTDSNGGTVKFDHLTHWGEFQVTSFVALSFSDGDINGSEELTYMADNTAKAGIEVSDDSWAFYLNAINRGDTRQQRIVNGENLISEGYTLFNLFGQYTHNWSEGITAEYELKVTNLLDEHYYNATFAQGEGFYASPQNTRKIELGINIRF
ncbi:TonB-dependent siderophore receptor [Aliikangiella sp. G2MR2-5]|uniref:TonB-dependent receptor plug domain-containing protein n=1 Tax=Aliikangiella sp. G2MR2-5 TaxID=2788943 RepID=UPI0018A8D777|nr:TonB-dependent receptor [Aliikangiella sp. G2MR2-5]